MNEGFVNCRALKIEKLLSSSPSQESALKLLWGVGATPVLKKTLREFELKFRLPTASGRRCENCSFHSESFFFYWGGFQPSHLLLFESSPSSP